MQNLRTTGFHVSLRSEFNSLATAIDDRPWLLAKNAAGKLTLPEGSIAERLEDFGFRVLSLTAEHVASGAALTRLHPDPFDCLLIGTARSGRLALLTRDTQLLAHAAPLLG